MNWLIGVALLIIVLASNFTGYLLPWDQLAYWAVTVSTSLLAYIPVIGKEISSFFLGGPIVGQGTLRNFYALHVAVLPVIDGGDDRISFLEDPQKWRHLPTQSVKER